MKTILLKDQQDHQKLQILDVTLAETKRKLDSLTTLIQ